MHECLYLFLDNSPANVWVLYDINAANANALPEAHRSTKPILNINPSSKVSLVLPGVLRLPSFCEMLHNPIRTRESQARWK